MSKKPHASLARRVTVPALLAALAAVQTMAPARAADPQTTATEDARARPKADNPCAAGSRKKAENPCSAGNPKKAENPCAAGAKKKPVNPCAAR